MKQITKAMLACAIILVQSCPLLSAEPNFKDAVDRFVKAVAGNDRTVLADLVSYPLRRSLPLPAIKNSQQFLDAYDEILDEEILRAVSTSSISADWSEMGSRGIMFQNGALWLDEEGRMTAINHQTEREKRKRAELIEADKQKLHSTLRDFTEPVLEWETAKFHVRIDRLSDGKYRYAVWPLNKKTTEQPDLVLRNGGVEYEGSGGNHFYYFNSGPFQYRCIVNVIGFDKEPPGELVVTDIDEVILRQPVVQVITGM